MTDTTVTTPAPRRRRGWLRALAWIFGILIVLLVVVYFVATSSAFFKGVILPKVSAALNANITVSDASISPFKEVVLRNLKVQTTGTEPLVTAAEVRLDYSLMDIIGGNIHVDELTVASPTVTLVTNPDGTSNLDPILKAHPGKPAQPAPTAQPSKPLKVDIKKVALTDATIRNLKLYQGGTRDVVELSHVSVTVDDVKNGQTGKLALGADISVDNNPPPPAARGLLQAKLNGNFAFTLSPDLKPASIQGNTRLDVTRAEGALAQAGSLAAILDCNVTPTEIKQVALRFAKGNVTLGELVAAGPLDMEKMEGRLSIQLINIDKNLLNLAGAGSGLEFGPTTIHSTNTVQLAKAGSLITAIGRFDLDQLQVTRAGQTTPPLDLHASYSIAVDQASSNAVVNAFNLDGIQKGLPVLKGDLASPMTINWGGANNPVGDSTLDIALTHLNLADWKPFLGDVAPAGDVNGKFRLVSQQAGKQLAFDLSSEIDNLTARCGSNQITQATVTLEVSGKAADLKQFNLSNCKLEVARQNQTLITASGAGTYDQAGQTADLQLNLQLMLARLLQALPWPDVSVSGGTAELKAHLTQKQKDHNVTGSFTLADFTGRVGSNSFQSFAASADFDFGMTPQQVLIRKLAGRLSQGQNPGGVFAVAGSYDLTQKSAQFTAKLADFNQDGLRPFLQPMLADKKLVSVALNANAAVQYDPQAASTVKADLQVTNLVVNDPKGQFPATPLAVKMAADTALNKQVAEIRQFLVALTPTGRATNQVQLTGRVDMSQTNAIQGNLKLDADSLDLTTYYDLFVGQKTATEPKPAAQPTPPPPSGQAAAAGPEKEPAPIQLPVRNFVADAAIGRFYLHEIEITNFQTTVKLDGGHVVLDPFRLALNGAPASATLDLDLGVPGYKYALAFSAQSIPLAPIVNTFQPDKRGILSGTASGQAKINGAGVTGASLQKSLTGQFDFSSTNLNLSVDNLQGTTVSTRLLKTLVKAITAIPDLVKNPASSGASLVQGFLGTGGGSAGSGVGTAPNLSKSPINSIVSRGKMGAGQIDLQQALVQSPAFEANPAGTVTIAPVLTNSSLQIPVAVSLERSVAQEINLAGNTPTNAAYAKLPDFLTITGTLGNPKSDINRMVIVSVALQAIGGKAGQAGSMLQGISGLVSGGASGTANASGTNQPGTSLGGLLQRGLGGAPGSNTPSATNAPPTATNPPPATQAPLGSLLNQLLKKK